MKENKSKFFIATNTIMILLFLYSAALQYNDPDPIQWAIIYLLAASLSFAFFSINNFSIKLAATIFIGICLTWSICLIYQISSDYSFIAMFQPMDKAHPSVELGRETGGLWIISSWVLFLFIRSFRKTTNL